MVRHEYDPRLAYIRRPLGPVVVMRVPGQELVAQPPLRTSAVASQAASQEGDLLRLVSARHNGLDAQLT